MRTSIIAAAAAGVALAGLAGMALAPRMGGGDAFAPCRDGQVAGGDIGGPFTLVDGSGRTVTEKEVFTEPSILYFGFTSCADVCPLDVARNAQAVDILAERGLQARPVFVSVDPERDTPEVVAGYAESFHPRLVALTGSADQVAEAAQAYRVYFAREAGDPDYYNVSHSNFSYLVLPEAGFVDFVNADESPEGLADRLQCFVEASA